MTLDMRDVIVDVLTTEFANKIYSYPQHTGVIICVIRKSPFTAGVLVELHIGSIVINHPDNTNITMSYLDYSPDKLFGHIYEGFK